jgi:hypothetical protein
MVTSSPVQQLGQFDLQFAFQAAGAAGEDIQYQAAAVNDFGGHQIFQIPLLHGTQDIEKHHQVGAVHLERALDLFGFALTDYEFSVGGRFFLPGLPDHVDSGRAAESLQFGHDGIDFHVPLLQRKQTADYGFFDKHVLMNLVMAA